MNISRQPDLSLNRSTSSNRHGIPLSDTHRVAGRRSFRAGFSMVELLVVMGVISLLLSLLLPATMRARGSARRLTCLNHLKQVSLAITMHTDQERRFPPAGLFAATGSRMYHNWVTSILPQLDQSALANQYDFSKPYNDSSNFELTQTPLPILACPDDVSVVKGMGNLSYVVNGGVGWTIPVDCPATLHTEADAVTIRPFDLNGNGIVCPLQPEPGPEESDLKILERMSLFFVENWPPKTGTQRHHQLRDVTDGTSITLLLTENVRAGYDPDGETTWGSPEPVRNMFFISSEICESGRCQPGKVDLNRANDRQNSASSRECLNAALTQAEGTAPWPSSGHPGLVNVAWCDGHVSALSELIDGRVYFAIVTPQGSHGSGLFAEPVVTGTEF